MFYTIYDAIIFQMEKKGIKEDEVKRILRENGVKAEELSVSYTHLTLPTKLEV